MESTKKCSTCSVEKPRSAFYSAKQYVDGLRYSCKQCDSKICERRRRALGIPAKPIKAEAPEGMKCCPKCNSIKPLAQFFKDAKRPDGLTPRCKDCTTASSQRWAANNAEHIRRRNAKNAGRFRSLYLKRKYALTEAEIRAILEHQGHRCAICGTDKPGGIYKNWPIDHRHDLGNTREAVRGAVCGGCNAILGIIESNRLTEEYIQQNPALYSAALNYIQDPPAQKVLG